MNRYITLTLMAVLLVLALANPSLAVFPKPDGSVTVEFQQGWFNDKPAWYFCTDTNNIRFAQTDNLTLAPKLSSALEETNVPELSPVPMRAARVMYIVTNFQQGPVFSTAPGLIDYSGLWRVVYITWKPGVTKHPITNADPDFCSPNGIPSSAEANIVCSGIVLDCPIIALGQLACEWLAGTPGVYRIPQVLDFDKYEKTVELPTYNVYTQDPLTRKVIVRRVVITDVSSQELADLLKANLAPGLLWMPLADTQRFWDFVGPRPPAQLPIFPNAPTENFTKNTNYAYSPIGQFTVFDRDNVIPQSTTITTESVAAKLAALYPNLVLSQNQLINAPIVPLIFDEVDGTPE